MRGIKRDLNARIKRLMVPGPLYIVGLLAAPISRACTALGKHQVRLSVAFSSI